MKAYLEYYRGEEAGVYVGDVLCVRRIVCGCVCVGDVLGVRLNVCAYVCLSVCAFFASSSLVTRELVATHA